MTDNTTAHAAQSQANADDLTVATTHGAVRGIVDKEVRTWRGIPFAAPPVGELRLRKPHPAEPWEGVRDASEFGMAPPQVVTFEASGIGKETPVGEDCLTLNVSAPLAPSAEPRPVLVYLYGGAYTTGSNRSTGYLGSRLVKNGDVIYVCLNYRLGALGFVDFSPYSTPERPFESNLGLRDTVAGLEWVRDNIAAFGGDPDNVTIFGESAGGMSVTSLMCIPSAKGLFHKAFAMSPAPASMYGPELHADWSRRFLENLGVDEADAAAALSERPWQDLIAASRKLGHDYIPDNQPSALPTAPVVDGDFLPKHTIDAFRDGDAHPVPFVAGTTDREGAFFTIVLDLMPTKPSRIDTMFKQTDPDARDRVVAAYPGYPSKRAAIDLGGDAIFWHPTIQVTEGHSRHAPTWSYRFDYAPPLLKLTKIGATHGTDVAAVFDGYDAGLGKIVTALGGRGTANALAQRFQGALLSLARTGSPGADWPQYDETARQTRIFDSEDRIESDPRAGRRLAWGDYRGHR
ncbi:carboxylesterase/lipase family protein [Salinibacterium sp. dk2585]|uniref:carboxylesterase/lipase family protein n=1 Tax=unclassified Salinibacterium TaxID=2632331 RepID=UPI0011C2479B|nr:MULTISPECIES: carboxylesterase/lipase family protein [unclassified Salinibacterium]QEE62125.1 carboxylesterase/lipase family protein [Salinibacterium sp. dk2585]TXK53477.1 carboxylesterase/lipase family protein [Salinibacterium sp. dk5596]